LTDTEDRRSWLERLLAVIAHVRPGEGLTVVIMAVNVFVLLTAYYMIKPVREELILATPGGAEFKAYASGATAIVLLVAVPVYSALANRLSRNRLIIGVTAFFVACMIGFYFLGQVESMRGGLGIPFYLWVGTFNMMVVAQFWGFANDIYTREQGERLFAIVGLGASSGAVVGAKLTAWLLDPPTWLPVGKLDVFQLLLLSAVLLTCTAILTQWAHVRERARPVSGPAPPRTQSPRPSGGFRLVFAHKYLMLLAAFSLLFTLANANGEYMLSSLVSSTYQALPEGDKPGWIGSFYGDFFFYVNAAGLLIQTFAVSRIVRYGGLRVAFFVLPVIVLLSSGLVAIVPVLLVLRAVKILENATDYSLNNTVRNMLWLPTTTEMKYKAKQAVDTFMVRLGDVAAGVLVFLGTDGLRSVAGFALSVRGFAIANLVVTVAWLILARRILAEHRAMAAQRESSAG
jgi:AAA family ATP:ADP antiporter